MRKYVHFQKLMGTAFSLGVIAKNQKEADYWLRIGVEEVQRIEEYLSEYRLTSMTSQINKAKKDQFINVPDEFLKLLQRCEHISQLTNGAFDVTAGVLKKMYSFGKKEIEFPAETIIEKALNVVGFQNIVLDVERGGITKVKPDMHISFNAIGKGFASDCVKKLWQKHGVQSGFINASGDLCAFGRQIDGTPWSVGIANPDDKSAPLFYLPLQNQAIATSGDYEQYFMWKGKKYSHNINPRTGYPLQGIKSVSVISPSAELSDALATAISVMGERQGIHFVNQLPNTHAIIINDENEVSFSKNLAYETVSL